MITKLKIIIVIIIVSTLIGIIPSYSTAEEPVPKQTLKGENVILDIEAMQFLKEFSRAYTKGDADEYMTFYSPVAMENGVNSLDKIKANYIYTISHNIITVFEIEASDIKSLGDIAIVDARYNKTLVEKSKGDALIISGNVRIKVVKTNDGLKIVAIDHDKYIKNEYTIGAEDVLEVSVWKSPDLSTSVTVRPDGIISIPLIGDIRASNRTTKELKEDIEQRLAEYKQDPIVSIIVRATTSQSIYVTGEVGRPGKYPLGSETTIIQAITVAGGFTQWADKDKIVIIRKSPMSPEGNRFTLKYSDIVTGKNMKSNILLQAGDTVIVP